MIVSEERLEADEQTVYQQPEFEALDELEMDGVGRPQISDNVVLQPSFWQLIRRFFVKSNTERDEERRTRMYLINQAIETYPTAAVNYVLRGELYLELKLPHLAKDDFEKALDLAAKQLDTERWGLGAQALQDRAESGLQRIN